MRTSCDRYRWPLAILRNRSAGDLAPTNLGPHRLVFEQLETRTLLSVQAWFDEIGSEPPTIVETVADFSVVDAAADTVLDLSEVFDDADLPEGDTLTFDLEISAQVAPVVDQISLSNYTHLLDDALYTHVGDDRGYGAEHDLARDTILDYFQSLGLSSQLEPFAYGGGTYHNVVGVKPGSVYPDEIYIVGAHYDSVNNPGADDNASGTAGVMEIARVLAQHEFESTLVFIAFDREEQGMRGSAAYAQQHRDDQILGMVNLDMIAYNPDGPGQDTILLYEYREGGTIKSDLIEAFDTYGNGVVAVDSGLMGRSDHASFEQRGFDAALLIEQGVWSNPHYHDPEDTVDTPNYIDYQYAANVVSGAAGYLTEAAGLAAALEASIVDDQLVLRYEEGRTGTVEVLLRATDSTGAWVEDTFTVTITAAAEVTGRYLFYNNCVHDGARPEADRGDDDAIATDKRALLPGETATFANYSSYSRGINGIMIDVHGLAGTPTEDDFRFQVGNDDNPEPWPDRPRPTSITVRPGEGVDGSDRVTILFEDNAVEKQWLRVSVLATANTALAAPDVFYFGSAVGDSGDSALMAMTSAADEIAVRHNVQLLSRQGVENPFDFDRDGYVSSADQIVARHNRAIFDTLRLITPPEADVAAARVSGAEVADAQRLAAAIDWLCAYESAGSSRVAATIDTSPSVIAAYSA